MGSTSTSKPWSRLALTGVLMFATLASTPAGAGSQTQPGTAPKLLVFYDPDANHKAILRITSLFNVYLSKTAPSWKFQPVHNRSTFEKLLRDRRTGLAIVSANYLREAGTDQLRPLLVPSSKGEVHFRKLLVDTGHGTAGDVVGKRVAAAATASDTATATRAIVDTLKAEKLGVSGVIALPVSKDIDALLAVSFGQADLALVTPMSIDVLKRINPAAARTLRVVFRTKPTLRPPLCAISGRVEDAELNQLTVAIREMQSDRVGRQTMKTLGFDEWTPYERRMLQ